jgi:hypothetical protein
MLAQTRDKYRFLAFICFVGVLISLFLLLTWRSIAGAQTDPNSLPFAGVLLPAPDDKPLQSGDPVDLNSLDADWRSIFVEDFETENWVDKWDNNLDRSSGSLGYKWGLTTVPNGLDPNSKQVGWGVGGGDNGSNLDPLAPNFPAGVNSWLVAGPFDLSSADDAMIDLDLFYESDGNDAFKVSVSYNRLDFVEQYVRDENISEGSWEPVTISLSNFIDPNEQQIWIAFIFSSDNGSAGEIGAMMDNINLMVEGNPFNFLPILVDDEPPTPPPATPTATRPPAGPRRYDFENNIVPWQAVRARSGSDFEVRHNGSSDDGRQGFLNIEAFGDEAYVIVSPLQAGPKPPYNIETVVKLRSPRETGNQYGIIFGANYEGGACPPLSPVSSCFSEYYEMRVRYYEDGDKTRMDMKLKRRDRDGDERDLIGWQRVGDIDEEGFIEWDINVSESGRIAISADDSFVDSETDTRYIDNVYFGVIVRNESDDTEAKFDYLKIDD